MLDREDPRPQVSVEMIEAGVHQLKTSGLLRDGADEDYARLMVAVSRVYSAMRKIEPARIQPKEIFLIGGGKRA